MYRPCNVRKRYFTDRIKIEKITLDTTPEVLIYGRYYDHVKSAFCAYQMVLTFDLFKDILIEMEDISKELFIAVTTLLPTLTAKPATIRVKDIQESDLIWTNGIFCLERLDLDKYLVKEGEKAKPGEEIFISKINTEDTCVFIWDYTPLPFPFSTMGFMCPLIVDCPKVINLAGRLHDTLLRYHYYLYLRSIDAGHAFAKNFVALRDKNHFSLAKTYYTITTQATTQPVT